MTKRQQRHDHFTSFTLGAGAVPGFSQRSAALRLQSGAVDVDLTAIVDDLQPAGALGGLCVSQERERFHRWMITNYS